MTAPQSPASASRPFAAAPDASRYFPSAAMEEARQRVGRSVQRGEGPVLVIGTAGIGKTMLLGVVAQQFGHQIKAVNLMGGQLCTRRALLQMILFQLDLPYRDMDDSELRLSLLGYLQPQGAAPRQILLLVDEADTLPPRLLEELRALTNISTDGQLLVNLVLAGNSTLEEQFADPKLDLFSQRISARCYLSAFGREETFQFVSAQVASAGHDPQKLFTDDALEAIFAATDGVPRLVNQLGDQLMWMVAETGYSPLDQLIVQQAWSEIQQLPAPWNTQPSEPQQGAAEIGGAVEFGELDANDEDVAEIVFEDDSHLDSYDGHYATDFDDDLPASIPIHQKQSLADETSRIDHPPIEVTSSETLDVTDQLLEQLLVIESNNPATPDDGENSEPLDTPQLRAPAVDNQAARNPFSESFESEEIVLDRYSTFESLLLAEAPRVINSADAGFSQQLQQLEAIDQGVKKAAADDSQDENNSGLATDIAPLQQLTSQTAKNNPGEILVIEGSDQPQATVVNGQKFRQLFSSLENSESKPRFG